MMRRTRTTEQSLLRTVTAMYTPRPCWFTAASLVATARTMLAAASLAATALVLVPRVAPVSDALAAGMTVNGLGAPSDPKIVEPWNRFHDVDAMVELLQSLERAHPGLAEWVDLGKSYEGRPIVGLAITNEAKGKASEKPAMYIDGNIHGNEVQAGEVVLYTAWYLLETYGEIERITKLLDEKAFYLVPTINPDGRDHWFHDPANPHLSRGGRIPTDEDLDGRFDEDGPDDLDGDGEITYMRIRDPWGRHEIDPEFPDELTQEVLRDEQGSYRLLGWEGYDNDGDGELNEDGPGGYDPNRDWPWQWQPMSIQWGARDYPFSLPSTRAVGDFVKSHPNIAGAQSFHNAGGMILRGPGQESGPVAREDEEILSYIGKRGEEMLPFYKSWITWKDLYTVWGGEFEWFYGALGVFAFTNELWTNDNLYRKKEEDGQEGRRDRAAFRRDMLMGDGFTPWKEFDHPDYGKVEIGGSPKTFGRVPPAFLIQEELHRNMAFTLYHAECMPLVRIAEATVEDAGRGLRRLVVTVENRGVLPTRSAHDVQNGINPPTVVSVRGAEVVAAGIRTDPYREQVTWQEVRPERVLVPTIPGLERVVVEIRLQGSGNATIEVTSTKAGSDQKSVRVG